MCLKLALRRKPGKEVFMKMQTTNRNMQTAEEGMIVGHKIERAFVLGGGKIRL